MLEDLYVRLTNATKRPQDFAFFYFYFLFFFRLTCLSTVSFLSSAEMDPGIFNITPLLHSAVVRGESPKSHLVAILPSQCEEFSHSEV